MERLKVISAAAVALGICLGVGTYACQPENNALQDGVTFEPSGTAVTGRESGSGWVDLECTEQGRLTIRLVDPNWEVQVKKTVDAPACDDKRLNPGEITQNEALSTLRS